jgi:molybdopterin synthase sulfur carrier subunit
MKIKILFFATLRGYVGEKSIEIQVPNGITVGSLKKMLVERYPRMAAGESSIMTAVNREYASDGQELTPDSEIAFFPPVSGG